MPILRVRHPQGTLKVDFVPEKSTIWLYEQVSTQLASLYSSSNCDSFWLCTNPNEPEGTRVPAGPDSLLSAHFQHGDLIFLHLKAGGQTRTEDDKKGGNTASSPPSLSPSNSLAKSSQSSTFSLDQKLLQRDGQIKRPRDARLCRHGSVGMCEHCQPLEVSLLG